MAGHSPYLSVTNTLIRINASATKDYLPDWIDQDEYKANLSISKDFERCYIGFVKSGEQHSDAYALQKREGGLHMACKPVRSRIISERGIGRYDCWWDNDENVLVGDLTTEVRRPQFSFGP